MHHVRKAGVVLVALMSAEAVPLALLLMHPHGARGLERLLGWGTPPIAAGVWMLSAVVAVAYILLSMWSLPFIRQHLFDTHPVKLLAIPFALITGSFEELFFRKSIMDVLAAHAFNGAAQAVSSAIAFGGAHAVWGLFGGSARSAIWAMIYTTALGLALAMVYLAAGRQLAPAAWSHIIINLIIEPWLMIGAMNLREGRSVPRST